MNQTSAWLYLCGLCCVWPFIWGIGGFMLHKYKPRLRSPFVLETGKITDEQQKAMLRRVAKKDSVGYGGS